MSDADNHKTDEDRNGTALIALQLFVRAWCVHFLCASLDNLQPDCTIDCQSSSCERVENHFDSDKGYLMRNGWSQCKKSEDMLCFSLLFRYVDFI